MSGTALAVVAAAEVPVHVPDGEAVPAGLLEHFWRYERALMADDLAELDRLFRPGPWTMRGDGAGLLVGHERIGRFRGGRGGAPTRRVLAVHVRLAGPDHALVVAETAPSRGGRGQQTQLWRRTGERAWAVEAAHVSAPAPAIDPAVWRVVGDPLVGATGAGALSGLTVAVKDVFAVAGHAVGGGVPDFLASGPVQSRHAPALAALLDAGASVRGIARTDQLAYSVAGRNAHYGTPPNVAVPGALPGGSSSGPASAVALGQADVGLATDTAGSIRMPASYQGLWGLRPTHGLVTVDGVLPLAPTFDTVGWIARDGATLATVAGVGLDAAGQRPLRPADAPAEVLVAPQLVDRAEPGVRTAFGAAVDALATAGALAGVRHVDVGDMEELYEAFRIVQAAEAWRSHGAWLTAHPGAVVGDVAERFADAAAVTPGQEAHAREVLRERAARIAAELAGRVLLLPSAASVAPAADASPAEVQRARAATLSMTCVAGVLGAPALSVPLLHVDGAPVGLCLVGPRGTDLALVELGRRLAGV
ncbi:AtzH-like domain-containing protein [Georgenia sp. AZ-5]|uniref:AtzH-like domain-containing protein n=1 Tax=Georgenia sp. AZ-5 TaxID=3367526 RepID=UPI0037543860